MKRFLYGSDLDAEFREAMRIAGRLGDGPWRSMASIGEILRVMGNQPVDDLSLQSAARSVASVSSWANRIPNTPLIAVAVSSVRWRRKWFGTPEPCDFILKQPMTGAIMEAVRDRGDDGAYTPVQEIVADPRVAPWQQVTDVATILGWLVAWEQIEGTIEMVGIGSPKHIDIDMGLKAKWDPQQDALLIAIGLRSHSGIHSLWELVERVALRCRRSPLAAMVRASRLGLTYDWFGLRREYHPWLEGEDEAVELLLKQGRTREETASLVGRTVKAIKASERRQRALREYKKTVADLRRRRPDRNTPTISMGRGCDNRKPGGMNIGDPAAPSQPSDSA